MAITIKPSGATCGARVTGINLSQALSENHIAEAVAYRDNDS